jgi:hypothetical protein
LTTPGDEGRFAGYDVVGQRGHWDEVTAGVVLARLAPPRGLAFFTEQEERTARCLVDVLLAQGDGPYVDVVADIDRRLARGETDGWHYEDLPEDGEAWRQSLRNLDHDAGQRFQARFADLDRSGQQAVVQGVQGGDVWFGLPAARVWSLWTRYACTAFYAHPWAWNEIGFGGPAYPRGYKDLGGREPWERPEHDAADPVPWGERVEAARKRHLR